MVFNKLLNAKETRDGEGQQNQATAWLGDAKDPNHPAWLRGPGPPSFGDFWGSPSGIEDMSFFWGDTHAQHVDINALREALREDMRKRSKRLKQEWFKFQVHLEGLCTTVLQGQAVELHDEARNGTCGDAPFSVDTE